MVFTRSSYTSLPLGRLGWEDLTVAVGESSKIFPGQYRNSTFVLLIMFNTFYIVCSPILEGYISLHLHTSDLAKAGALQGPESN